MLNLNKVMIIGNLTRDPEMRYTPNGAAVTSFGVATNRRWTGQDGNATDEVEFHDVTAWGKLAEIATQVLRKGAPAFVEGRLRTHSWEGQDGVKRFKTEIVAENLIALSGKPGGSSDYAPSSQSPVDEPVQENPVDEISKPAKESKVQGSKSPKEDTPDEEEEINIEDIPF